MKHLKKLFPYQVTTKDLLFSTGILTGLSLASITEWLIYHELPKVLMALTVVWSIQLIWMVLDYTWRAWQFIKPKDWYKDNDIYDLY